tara:strand:- start:5962 stop:7239 length:1278 start_codon:yes stop_codon:yes gene_type:complete
MNLLNYLDIDVKNFSDNPNLDSFLNNICDKETILNLKSIVASILKEIIDLDQNALNLSYQSNNFVLLFAGYELIKIKDNKTTIISDTQAFSYNEIDSLLKNTRLLSSNGNIDDNIIKLDLDISIFKEDIRDLNDLIDSILFSLTTLYLSPNKINYGEYEFDNDLVSYFDPELTNSDYLQKDRQPDVDIDNKFNLIKTLIESDEIHNIEFKTAFFELKEKAGFDSKNNEITKFQNEKKNVHINTVLETVNAFLNHDQKSYLLLGVSDDGCPTGIEKEFGVNQSNVNDLRSYEEKIFAFIKSTMGPVATSNIKLDFIKISHTDINTIEFVKKCDTRLPLEFIHRALHREKIEKDVTVGLLSVIPSKVPIFFKPLNEKKLINGEWERYNSPKYMAKDFFFTRGGSSDQSKNSIEEIMKLIKNKFPDYF